MLTTKWVVFFFAVHTLIAIFGGIMEGSYGSQAPWNVLMTPEFSLGWLGQVVGSLWQMLTWNFAIFTSSSYGTIVRFALLVPIAVGLGWSFLVSGASLIRGGGG